MKERLVGAAVLVAIAVWLIPWVLDGPDAPMDAGGNSLQLPPAEEPMPMRTQTLRLGEVPEPEAAAAPTPAPSPPPAEPVVAADPPAAAEEATAAAPEAAEPPAVASAQPEPVRAPAAAPPAPAAAPKPTASAPASGDWIVQLGSFSDEANARRLAQRSGTFGYKADVSSYRSGDKTLYRVRVGPAQSRAAADAAASALKAHGIKDARVVAAR